MALEPRLSLVQTTQQAPLLDQRTELTIKALATIVLGFWAALHPLYQALAVLILADFATGIMASLASGRKLSSDISLRGFVKKSMAVLMVALGAYLEPWAGGVPVGPMIAGYWCGHEGISILENYAVAGLPVPQQLRDVLEKLSSQPPRGPMPPGALA